MKDGVHKGLGKYEVFENCWGKTHAHVLKAKKKKLTTFFILPKNVLRKEKKSWGTNGGCSNILSCILGGKRKLYTERLRS